MKSKFSLGLTLTELMVTLSVAGILLVVGVPNFTTMIQNNRMSAKLNEVVAEINFARSEAVKRGSPVIICKRNTAGNDCDANANWANGWIVFSDADGNGKVDATTEILRVHGALTGITSIQYSNTKYPWITFNASGAAPFNNTYIIFCDSRGSSQAKGLTLADTGRLRKASKEIAADKDKLVCP